MCETCGCGETGDKFTIIKPGEKSENFHSHNGYWHSHADHIHSDHSHGSDLNLNHQKEHVHTESDSETRTIKLELDILGRNNLLAERNRGFFEAKSILALNLVSSPGSGKTSILERTVKESQTDSTIYVIEGDQQTSNDALRIEKAGAPAIQINTGNGCHLDAQMIHSAVKKLDIRENSILFIENVGNLVCPALFDLGESFRVVITSVTEGEDKPLKYPTMFQTSHLCLINKIDLLPYLDFSMDLFRANAHKINPNLKFIELSAKSGEGFEDWFKFIKQDHQLPK
jgi:hydrogenase nickel incorporation protein HypB